MPILLKAWETQKSIKIKLKLVIILPSRYQSYFHENICNSFIISFLFSRYISHSWDYKIYYNFVFYILNFFSYLQIFFANIIIYYCIDNSNLFNGVSFKLCSQSHRVLPKCLWKIQCKEPKRGGVGRHHPQNRSAIICLDYWGSK